MPDVLNTTRERVNDMIVSVGGQTLTNTAPFTLVMANAGWQVMQQQLVALGYVVLQDSLTIVRLPPVATLDPSTEVSLSWTGYFDGTTAHPAIVLPQDLIRPMKDGLEERISVNGTVTNTSPLSPMDEILGPLAHVPKEMWNKQWQWRADAICMPGAMTYTDMRIRYAKYLADFTNLDTDVAPIMRCGDALSKYIAVEFSTGRGDLDRATLLTEAQQATAILAGVDIKDAMLVSAAERDKMKDRYSGTGGPGA